MAAQLPTPRLCIQHSRFTKQYGWRLWDLSLSSNGNIAVTGYNENTRRTYIDVYTNVSYSDSRNKPKIIYSKEFEKYEDEEWIYDCRYVSFINDDDVMVSCLGNKLDVFQVNKDEVLRSRRVNGVAHCLSVRERREIFIGFYQSNKITVYDVIDLNEIKSIILQGIQDGYWPYDMAAIADRVFVCEILPKEGSNQRSLICDEKNGRILSELTKPTDTVQWYVFGLALNTTLNVIAVVWSQSLERTRKWKDVIVFYSLLSENNCSFLIVEVEFGVNGIRISDRGDRMIWKNRVTQECKVYGMSQFFSYGYLRENLQSQLKEDDCLKLTDYFALPDDQRDEIFKSDTPTENLLLALEGKGVIQPSNVDRLAEAFTELEIKSSCSYLVDFYQKTRVQATPYGRFLATLSAHLTASLPADLCRYFDIADEKKSSITSSPDPGLSLLLALDELGIINPSEVEALEQPFSRLKLVQAEAKIHEYQLITGEEKNRLQRQTELTKAEKDELFIQCLQKKIQSWYETMTPLPWKKSCRWKSTDLFVGSGLVLIDSKAKRSFTDIDEECKLQYNQIINHNRLKTEKRIILEGEPGSGKTMMSSQLAYDWSQGKISEVDVLVFLPLKFVKNITLVEAVKRFYFSIYDSISVNDIESFLTNEDLQSCLILDGFEEYNSAEMTPAGESSEVTKVMEKSKYPNVKVILTSRSDYAKDLPACPMLRIGKFGEKERNTYIEKVFADNTEKQQEIKWVIENNAFILDLCRVPLLFVLAVHNIEGIIVLQERQLDRVAPFMENMVKKISTLPDSKSERSESDSKGVSDESLLQKFAYNGLCKGQQILSWQRNVLEGSITNLKPFFDSGILVVEEGIVKGNLRIIQNEKTQDGFSKDKKKTKKIKIEDTGFDQGNQIAQVGAGAMASSFHQGHSVGKELGQADRDLPSREYAVTLPPSSGPVQLKPESQSEPELSESQKNLNSSSAKDYPLEVKFLHKVMQEWFASKHFSSLLWKSLNDNSLHDILYEVLPKISPIDLHYILRFTSYLCPPSCYLIMDFLGQNHCTVSGEIPEYIINCICLCFTECKQGIVPQMTDLDKIVTKESMNLVVAKLCRKVIIIRSDDSRITQQSKVAMLKYAASVGILIKEVHLVDVVLEVDETSITLNSGVTFDTFNMIEVLEMSRWDQELEQKDYQSIVNLVLCSNSITKARKFQKCVVCLGFVTITYHTKNFCPPSSLHFPSQPPNIEQEVLGDLVIYDKTVEWIIGPKLIETLNMETFKWEVTVQTADVHATTVKQISVAEVGAHVENYFEAERPEHLTISVGDVITDITLVRYGWWQGEVNGRRGSFPCNYVKVVIFNPSKPAARTRDVNGQLDTGFIRSGTYSWHEKNIFDAEAVISREGGKLCIPNTGVKLYIPPNAFEDDIDQCLLQIRIILPGACDVPATSFTSNTSTVVELLPKNLRLKQTVILTLPHCLDLEVDRGNGSYTAKILISHHEKGTPQAWEEKSDLLYYLDNQKCVIWLESFCWVKFEINGAIVKGKKIQVFAAGKVLEPSGNKVETEVGYFRDLPAGGEIIRSKKHLIISQQKPFLFLKKTQEPLALSLLKITPLYWNPLNHLQEIPYECIANSEEYSCPFIFENKSQFSQMPVCIFRISQGRRSFQLTLRPKGPLDQLAQNKNVLAKVTSSYTPQSASEVSLVEGDIIEITSQQDSFWWEGVVNGKQGHFPSHCVDPVPEYGEERKQQDYATPELLQQPLPGTEAVVTTDMVKMTIPDTKVVLNIPSGALPEHIEECVIKMRLVPRKMFKDNTLTFSSHSSEVVEILPNNLILKRPAQLILPHCLLLKENKTPTAKIYMSHHQKGCLPCWEEHLDLEYCVERTHCIVWLKSFCWVTVKVDDKDVLAKHLILYSCGKKLMPEDKYAVTAVGYYPDLNGERKFLNLNKNMMVSEMNPFVFMKEGSFPLCVLLVKHSAEWDLWSHQKRMEISFDDISSSFEHICKFVFQKTDDSAQSLMCLFQAYQEKGQQAINLTICPELHSGQGIASRMLDSSTQTQGSTLGAGSANTTTMCDEDLALAQTRERKGGLPIEVEENLIQNIKLDESQETPNQGRPTSSYGAPDAAVRPKESGQRKPNKQGKKSAFKTLTLYQPDETDQMEFDVPGQVVIRGNPKLFPNMGVGSRWPYNPFLQQYPLNQYLYASPYSHAIGSSYFIPNEDTPGQGGAKMRYSPINAISNKLDSIDPRGNDWRQLADKLGFSWDDITIFESAPSSTVALIDCAIKSGRLKSLAQLKAILIQIERSDAASLINTEESTC